MLIAKGYVDVSSRMMEGMGISHGMRQPATALERFYTAGPLIGSNGVTLLQGMDNSDAESAVNVMQDREEMKNGVMSSLRSPIAGDLASPQHCAPSSSSHALISSTPTYVAIKVGRAVRVGRGVVGA